MPPVAKIYHLTTTQTCADLLNHYEYTSPKTLNCPKIYRYDQVCYFYSNQAVQYWHRTRIYVFNSSQNWPCKNKTYMYKTLCSTMSPCCIQVYHSPDYCVLQRKVSFLYQSLSLIFSLSKQFSYVHQWISNPQNRWIVIVNIYPSCIEHIVDMPACIGITYPLYHLRQKLL